MTQTVVGIFEKGIDAQMAAQKLESNNIKPGAIDILHNDSNSNTSASTTSPGPAAGIAPGATASVAPRDAHRDNIHHDKSSSVSNFFRNLFDDEDEANKYTNAAQKSWIVTVHADSKNDAERAAETLDSCGAIDVNERSRRNTTAGANTTPGSRDMNRTTGDTSIPIVEERMEVGKRSTETGGVQLRSRILERPVEEKLRLREEHVFVERNPVNRPASEADLQNFKEGETKITERAEVPLVNKEARVVEEVKIGKKTEEHTETVRGTERKTEVDVDKIDPNRRDQGRPGSAGIR